MPLLEEQLRLAHGCQSKKSFLELSGAMLSTTFGSEGARCLSRVAAKLTERKFGSHGGLQGKLSFLVRYVASLLSELLIT